MACCSDSDKKPLMEHALHIRVPVHEGVGVGQWRTAHFHPGCLCRNSLLSFVGVWHKATKPVMSLGTWAETNGYSFCLCGEHSTNNRHLGGAWGRGIIWQLVHPYLSSHTLGLLLSRVFKKCALYCSFEDVDVCRPWPGTPVTMSVVLCVWVKLKGMGVGVCLGIGCVYDSLIYFNPRTDVEVL